VEERKKKREGKRGERFTPEVSRGTEVTEKKR
jgi:hypothetical protein